MAAKKAADMESKLGQRNMLLALEKKKRCNARAQLLVEEFIDLVTDTGRFLEKLQFISRANYEDIVVERAIERNCGYPMCPGRLDEIPNKKYHICRTSNTVYDITERKQFCSTGCFRASNYIREQLLTSPLWLRDSEPPTAFHLLADWRSPAEQATSTDAVHELNAQLQEMKIATQ